MLNEHLTLDVDADGAWRLTEPSGQWILDGLSWVAGGQSSAMRGDVKYKVRWSLVPRLRQASIAITFEPVDVHASPSRFILLDGGDEALGLLLANRTAPIAAAWGAVK